MEYKSINKLFKSHNEARDYLAENPHLLIEGSELVQVEFKVVKGQVDILLKKGDVFYFVEVKHGGSLYSARQQLSRYGRMFERFSPLFQDKKLKYIVVKVQRYLGTDIYIYDDVDDVLNRKNNYQDIHYERLNKTRQLPEVIENMKKARNNPKNKKKWEENWKKAMIKYHDKNGSRRPKGL